MTGMEIAEDFTLPDALDSAWHARGYYGSVSHNVKAIYQRYLGWFDGNPTSLWQHPPAAAASRYVEAIGGREAILAKAAAYADDGDLRFAAELLKHAVFDDPSDETAQARAGRRLRAARVRRGERDLALVLPGRGRGAARGSPAARPSPTSERAWPRR